RSSTEVTVKLGELGFSLKDGVVDCDRSDPGGYFSGSGGLVADHITHSQHCPPPPWVPASAAALPTSVRSWRTLRRACSSTVASPPPRPRPSAFAPTPSVS